MAPASENSPAPEPTGAFKPLKASLSRRSPSPTSPKPAWGQPDISILSLKQEFEDKTFGAISLSWDKARKRAAVFNTASPLDMHSLFDELDTHKVGMLSKAQISKLLVEDRRFQEDIVTSELFWRTFCRHMRRAGGHSAPDYSDPDSPEHRVDQDEFLLMCTSPGSLNTPIVNAG